MQAPFFAEHWIDENANPEGGTSWGNGFCISWQHGPLGEYDTPGRKMPNGAFVETVTAAVVDRIKFYQQYFPCQENAEALDYLAHALEALNRRTNRRIKEGVEGTHGGK